MSQTVTVSEATPLSYPFLSQPPKQKKRPAPTCPLPSPPVGSTAPAFSLSLPGLPPATRAARSASSTISSWAAAVHPGSPSPLSPRSRTSYISSSITSIRIASASFINVTFTGEGLTANPSDDPFKADFLIPDTPISPAPLPRSSKRNGYLNLSAAAHVPESVQGKNVKRFRSLTSLRMGKRSTSGSSIPAMPASPAPPVPALPAPPRKATPTSASVKGKKAVKPVKTGPQALALHNEAALLQLLDGGSMHTNAQRVLNAEVSGTNVGQTAAYKDPNGALWRDADEALEFAHLLDGATLVHTGGPTDWVSFPSPSATTTSGLLSSAGNQTPGLMQQMPLTPLSPSMLALGQANGVLVPVSPSSPQFSIFQVQRAGAVLAMPCRPRRSAERQGTEHLREAAFLLCTDSKEVEMARAAATLPTPVTPTSSGGKFKLPKVPAGRSKRMRRRPAPLDLPVPSSDVQAVILPSAGADRAGFLDASFEPMTARSAVPWAPGTPAVPPPNLPASHPLANVPEGKARRGLKGLFKRGGRS